MTDTEILNFLDQVTVDTIYMDSGEAIDVQGGDVRAAIVEAMARERCAKCQGLLIMERTAADDSGFCPDCGREEGGE